VAEEQLSRRNTAWIKGRLTAKPGQVIVTNARVLFVKKGFAPPIGGHLDETGAGVGRKWRARKRTPMVELPLSAITGVSRSVLRAQRDRLTIATADREYLFSDGWTALSPLLREQLTAQGREIVDDGPDAWRVH
jgi:hypothetical protein